MASSVKFSTAVLHIFVGTLLLSACGTPSYVKRPADEIEQLSGEQVAAEMVNALGGFSAYHEVQQIEFSFVLTVLGKEVTRRFHAWDKSRGLAYVRFTHDDEKYEAWVRISDKSGVVKIAGQQLAAAEAKPILEEAYAMWVNDVYWLIAPYKVFDEGVHRAYLDGKLRISFDKNVGLTPGDVYFFELDAQNRPQLWTFYLEGNHSAGVKYEHPVVFDDVTFYLKRSTALGEVHFRDLRVYSRKRNDRYFRPLL